MRVVRFLLIAGVVAAGLPALAQTVVLRPGNYAIAMEMEMAGQKVPPQKHEQCITPADLKDFSQAMLSKDMKGCKVSDYKAEATKITFNAQCNQGGTVQNMAFEMTLTADTYNAVMKSKTTMGEMTMKMAGKRIGDCTK